MNTFDAMKDLATPTQREDQSAELSPALYRRIVWRLMPLLLAAQVLAYLDRVNVGTAKLQMAGELGFSEAVYGFGAGIFFLGYFIFEVPSNLMLRRFGARRWIARIMITWGVAAGAAALVHTPATFYLQRLLLGMAEAGFFPGIVLYLTYWFPARQRGRMTTLFMSATAAAGIFGNVVSGWVMVHLDGVAAMAGWRWSFILAGLPTVVVGVAIRVLLPDTPGEARWLSPADASAVRLALVPEEAAKLAVKGSARLPVTDLLLLAAIYFLLLTGLYGVGFWLPTLIKSAGVPNVAAVGFYGAIPYVVAIVTMNGFARRADRNGTWPAHVVLGAVVASTGFAIMAFGNQSLPCVLIGASLGCAGILTALPLYWNLPTARLAGVGAAAGIAAINSIGNLSGFFGPLMFGWLKDRFDDATAATLLLALCAALAALLTLAWRARSRRAMQRQTA
ncbi:MFS transporter [Paraburkholderia unamae]|uniref:Sugar phosphate permease n=1 Tax=Paraburkholderia unamae TaxID=219649 RepID=A0ABX5KSW9_9BURK|nr:MFS transporter [Paraburkholderia unamae]PVX85934.1 sugar phosphate permease [Paraburkholderia unamae]